MMRCYANLGNCSKEDLAHGCLLLQTELEAVVQSTNEAQEA